MSQILVQESKYEKYARLLEESKYRQIYNRLKDGKGGMCAIGVLLYGPYVLDLPYRIHDEIIHMNNSKHSFKEIAQWLREQK